MKRHGNYRPIEQRFFPRLAVMPETGCHEWTGAVTRDGYGHIHYEGALIEVHRLALILADHEIPDGFHVHHTCRNPICANPEHLQVLSPREHARAHASLRTHCKNGHEFTEANTRREYRRGGLRRVCRSCEAQNQRAYKARKKVAA